MNESLCDDSLYMSPIRKTPYDAARKGKQPT
jgi:hypothetical protein